MSDRPAAGRASWWPWSRTPHEAYGPRGDSSRHLDAEALRAGLAALATPPRDRGVLTLIVRRRADGVRDTPPQVALSLEDGIPGDGWGRRSRNPDTQITVMRRDVAELVANGQPLTVFGDNLFVDLDISAANLPAGTRVRIGDALLEMTPKPHNGCKKFSARFGDAGVRFVQDPATRHLNLRGVHLRVVEAGEITVGAAVEIVSRS